MSTTRTNRLLLMALVVTSVLILLALGFGVINYLATATHRAIPPKQQALTELVGSEVTVQFRRDAAGVGTLSPGVDTDSINGARVSLRSKLLSVEPHGLVVESYSFRSSGDPRQLRSWIPWEVILMVSQEIPAPETIQPQEKPADRN